jgi:phage-related protein (TIGR01555 family)
MTKRRARRARVSNATVTHTNGAGGAYDQGAGLLPGFTALPPLLQDRVAAELFHTDWAAHKIVTIPVTDMLREGWTTPDLSEQEAARLAGRAEALGVSAAFDQAMTLERLVGGAVIFLGLRDGQADPATPALATAELAWLNVIPRTRVSVAGWQTDPLAPDYGRPRLYNVAGHVVHASRLVVLDGKPLTKTPDTHLTPAHICRSDGFGQSVLLRVMDDLMRAPAARQAAMHLIQRASVIVAEQDLADLESTEQGTHALQATRDLVNMLSNYRGAVIDRPPGQTGTSISTLSASFGSVPELVVTFLQVLSAASDIPATRFLGQAPGGLNATGESDLENYYGRLASDQRKYLQPGLQYVLTLLHGAPVRVEFPPLWSMSELEEADIRAKDAATISGLVTSGTLDPDAAVAELVARGVLTKAPAALPEPTGPLE